MTDAISAALWDVSGTRMYARNAFRLTDLPTDAGRQDVLHGQQRVVTMRQVDPDLASPEMLAAFDLILGDPRRRLVDEVFWLWDTPDTACGCTGSLHSDHDEAIRAHSAVLDHENAQLDPSVAEAATRQRLWELASTRWAQMLRRAAFWDHIRHRIVALDDRQLDDSNIDVLREVLPAVLVKPLVQLAVSAPAGQPWRAELARAWPAPKHIVDDQLEEAAGPLYEAVEQARTRALQLIEDGYPRQAVELIDEQEPTLDRLEELVPPDRHRRTATALNQAAIVYNNAAIKLGNMEGILVATTCEAWYDTAHALATNPQTIGTIEENDTALDKEVEAIESLEREIVKLVTSGLGYRAKEILLRMKNRLPLNTDSPDLDRLLNLVRGPGPVTIPRRGYGRSGSSPGKKALVFTLAAAALVLLLVWLLPDAASAVSVPEERRADNAAPRAASFENASFDRGVSFTFARCEKGGNPSDS